MDDRSQEVKAVAATFMSVAAVTVMMRCYVRLRVVKSFGWDDGAMVIAMLFYFMFSGCMIGGSLYGTGKHFDVLTAHQRVTAMEYWWFCEIAYCFSSVGCKVSVCIFLLRITVKRVHIWILYLVMALTVVTGVVFMFVMLLQCKPLEYFWTRTAFDPSIEGRCVNIQVVIAMTYVYSAFAALCDFTVGILPIFLVRTLTMQRRTKVAVVGILSMACMCVPLTPSCPTDTNTVKCISSSHHPYPLGPHLCRNRRLPLRHRQHRRLVQYRNRPGYIGGKSRLPPSSSAPILHIRSPLLHSTIRLATVTPRLAG